MSFIVFITLGIPSVMPTEFDFNQSSEQMFYFFINAEIGGEVLEPEEDWIAAFKGDKPN